MPSTPAHELPDYDGSVHKNFNKPWTPSPAQEQNQQPAEPAADPVTDTTPTYIRRPSSGLAPVGSGG